MYDKLRQAYCWSHMASNAYVTIARYESGVANGSRYHHKRAFQLFPATGPLNFVAMDILEPLSIAIQDIQSICVMTDQ